MPAFAWTAELDTLLRNRAADGVSMRKIAAEVGTSDATVRRRLRTLGVVVDRSRTEAATAAAVVDVKARRAAVAQRMLGQAESILARLEAPTFTTIMRGSFGVEEEQTVSEPPARDHRDLLSAAQIAVNTALKVDEHDRDTGTAEAVGALDGIERAIRDAAAALGPDVLAELEAQADGGEGES
jgi:AcrR family transcriptional regulator